MKKTDWDAYYEKPFKAAYVSRKITGNVLVKFIKRYGKKHMRTIMEIGGANSCFYDLIQKHIAPNKYVVIDNNQYGLDKFAARLKGQDQTQVSLINGDILNPTECEKVDLVFSVGLVEHFSKEDTEKAINNHFKYVKDDGIVIVGFPTPTFLYQTVRKCAEILGMWMFPDERPIAINEAMNVFENNTKILEYKILWPIVLTQAFFVLKKI